MREIKFRGKRLDNGEWMYGDFVKCNGKTYISNYYEVGQLRYSKDDIHINEVIPDTVGQFTGLYDKNGQGIYEGDFLNSKGEVIGYVKGDVRAYCYDVIYISHPKGETRWPLYSTCKYDYPNTIEVIGNIHDNPELLQLKKEIMKE